MSLMALVRRRHTLTPSHLPHEPRVRFFWNNHDEPDGVGQAVEERVARVREGAEEAQLRANVARGDSPDRGRGWDVR